MFDEIIQYMNKHKFVSVNELIRITGSDKAFILYAVNYINRKTEHHFIISGERVIRQSDKCKGCPYFK